MNLEERKEKMKGLMVEIEKILDHKKLTGDSRKDEFQKIFSCIIQDVDIVNTYERRSSGVADSIWDKAIENFYKGIKGED